jgi:hypothetical protein
MEVREEILGSLIRENSEEEALDWKNKPEIRIFEIRNKSETKKSE